MHIRSSLLLLALLAIPLAACDSAPPEDSEETVADVWEGKYTGVGEEIHYDGDTREIKENLDIVLRLGFSNEREIDSLHLRYTSSDSSRRGYKTVNDVLLLTKDTLVTPLTETNFGGEFVMGMQIRMGWANSLLKGARWRYYTEDQNDMRPDSTVIQFTVSAEPK